MSDIVYGVKLTGDASGLAAAYEKAAKGQQQYEAQVARQQALMEKLKGAHGEARKAILDEVEALQRSISASRDLTTAQSQAQASAAAHTEQATKQAKSLSMVADAARRATQALLGGAFARAVIAEALESEQANIRLEAQLRATGHAAGLAKVQIDELADSLAETSQFDDEAIRGAASEFLLLGNIQGKVFTEGIKLAVDYAAATGRTVPAAAATLGKALQSPSEGLGMLERQIGRLTPAQDEMIKQFMKSNDLASAQAAILEIVRQKVGGTADQMNTGLTKATSSLTKSWDELLESIGRSDAIGGAASVGLGLASRVLNGLKNVVDAFNLEKLRAIATLDFRTKPVDQAAIDKAEAAGRTATQQARDSQWDSGFKSQQDKLAKIAEDAQKKATTSAQSEQQRRSAFIARQLAEEQQERERTQTEWNAWLTQQDRTHAENLMSHSARMIDELDRSWAIFLGENVDRVAESVAATSAKISLEEAERRKRDEARAYEEVKRQAERLREEDQRRADGIERDLRGALMRGFEGGQEASKIFWNTMKNYARTVVLEPLIKPIVQPFAQAGAEISKSIGSGIAGMFGTGGYGDSAEIEAMGRASDTGGIASFFGNLFGGGRATGGPVSAGRVYEVNEGGAPEMATLGGRQFLLPGASGQVTPLQEGSSGMTVHAPMIFNVNAPNAAPGMELQIASTLDRMLPGALYQHRRQLEGILAGQRRERGRA